MVPLVSFVSLVVFRQALGMVHFLLEVGLHFGLP